MADVFNKDPASYVDMNDLFPELNEKTGLSYEQWRKAIENSNYLKTHLGVTKVAIGKEPEVIIVDNPEDAKIDVSVREVKEGDTTIVYLDFVHYVPAGKVTSVNGQTGSVNISADSIGAVPVTAGDNTITNTNESIILNAYKDLVVGDTTLENVSSSKLEMDGATAKISYNSSGGYSSSESTVGSDGILLSYIGYGLSGGRTPASSIAVGGKISLAGDTTISTSNTIISANPTTSTSTVDVTPNSFEITTSYSYESNDIIEGGGSSQASTHVDETTFKVTSSGVTINDDRVAVLSDIENAIGNVSSLLGDTDDLEV